MLRRLKEIADILFGHGFEVFVDQTIGDEADERRFRREVVKALAYTWAEDFAEALQERQADVDSYTSQNYWLEHP